MENTVQICAKTKTENTDKIFEKSLHERFKQYGKNAREWTRKCALLLPEIEKRAIWRKRGFPNIYEYARILAGMSSATVDAALWTLRKAEDKPALMKVIEEKGIGAVRPIANLATPETDKFWAEKTREMSVRALEAYAKEYRKSKFSSCHVAEIHIAKQTQNITMELEPDVAQKLEKLKGQSEWNALMKKFIEMHEAQMEAQKPAPIENAGRYVPTAIKKHALAKTAGTCAFPGCSKPYEILHHAQRYALTHAHDPDSLIPLCKAHERLVHLGLIENEEKPPNEWQVRMRPDESDKKYKIDQLVARHREGPGEANGLVAQHRAASQ